jgi:hypothetical protein
MDFNKKTVLRNNGGGASSGMQETIRGARAGTGNFR